MRSTSSVSMPRALGVIGLLLSVLLLSPQEAQAQHWLRTVSVVTPVEGRPVKAFLDTLVNVMERREGLKVKREPTQQEGVEIERLRAELINEEGVGFSSATDVFIRYKFSDSLGDDFKEQIVSFYFVFRAGPNQEDIPILYLDARMEWVKEVMNNKAIGLATNEAPLLPFRREFRFLRIAQLEKAQIVEIGNEPVREGFQRRKEALISKIRRLIYSS